jgi:CRISPR-associated protein Csd1
MCLLAQIQEAAADAEINAGVIQRYYGAASSTPALVLGRLTRLSQHHLAKLAKDSPGLAYWFNTQLAEVWKALGKTLPRTLSLEEQSLFALGYYQQLAASRVKKDNPETAQKPLLE